MLHLSEPYFYVSNLTSAYRGQSNISHRMTRHKKWEVQTWFCFHNIRANQLGFDFTSDPHDVEGKKQKKKKHTELEPVSLWSMFSGISFGSVLVWFFS